VEWENRSTRMRTAKESMSHQSPTEPELQHLNKRGIALHKNAGGLG
jgi:hypothetical protein